MKRIRQLFQTILAAANSAGAAPAPVRASAVLDPGPELAGAANARIIEGKMTIPFGLWPVEARNPDGTTEKVFQRVDAKVASRLAAAFNSLKGRVARFVEGGLPVYVNLSNVHPDRVNSKQAEDWKRAGKIIGVSAANGALEIVTDLSDGTKTMLAANSAIGPSPFWGILKTGELKDGVPIAEPVALYSLTLVPRVNIPGSAANAADDSVAPDSVALALLNAQHDQELALLAAVIAEMQADDDEDDTTIASLQAQLAALTAGGAQKDAALADLQQKLDALQAAFGAQLDAVLGAAANAGLIIPADVAAWKDKLAKTPSAANALIDPARILKTKSEIAPERAAAANASLVGVTAVARFTDAVRAQMAKNGDGDWDRAWNQCRETHREVFNLMK